MVGPKIILGIETSCDETACAILQKHGDRVQILSNVVASSVDLQAKYGGIIPEQAAREQLKSMLPVIEDSLRQAQCKSDDLDAIAVTYGPGLIGSLLVGVETAKTLALLWNKLLIPVNHLLGHFYANWIDAEHLRGEIPKFPAIGLLVSGGHTDLILMKGHGEYKYLGGTRDDASGECFDKCARLLGLSYPGGPAISNSAREGNPAAFDLPRPMIDSKDLDFSFSGLKTATANLIKELEKTAKSQATKKCCAVERTLESMSKQKQGCETNTKRAAGRASGFLCCDELANLAASIEAAIVDILVTKTIRAAQEYKVNQIMVAGGVASNQRLVSDLKLKVKSKKLKVKLYIPPPYLCTDNAAMIAAAAFFNFQPTDPLSFQANPNLSLTK